MDLLFTAPESEFYAFCDQDDVWDNDKLLVSVSRLKDIEGPALYHAKAGRVDENLLPLYNKPYYPINNLGGALLTSSTGCTMVFNKELMYRLRLYKPKHVSMHDAWVYRVSYALNAIVIYDNNSHLKYRQHSANVTGGQMTLCDKIKRILIANNKLKSDLAKEILYGYESYLSNDNKVLIEIFSTYNLSLRKKYKLLCNRSIKTHSIKTNIINDLLIIIGVL